MLKVGPEQLVPARFFQKANPMHKVDSNKIEGGEIHYGQIRSQAQG